MTLSYHGVLSGSEFVHPLYREVQAAVLVRETRVRLAQRIVTLTGEATLSRPLPLGRCGLSDEAACDLLTRAAEAALSRGGRDGQASFLLKQPSTPRRKQTHPSYEGGRLLQR
jgi:hypothetical protein